VRPIPLLKLPISHPFTPSIPVPDSATSGFPLAEFSVVNSNPIWVYCRQGNHCQQGMVFAINPGEKFAAFQAAATGGTAPPASSATSVSSQPPTTTSATTTSAATTSAATAPSSTPSGVDHKVIVGGPNILSYSPSNITAQVGDTITFEFHQKNHTITASSFDAPCRALALTSTTGQVGFDSGL
jgi:plastocyanin